jgi:hypothetical protein
MKSNIAIFGPVGSGKTWSLRTLLPEYPNIDGKIRKGAGLQVREIACDPGWSDTNGDLTCEMGFHVKEVLPANPSWKARREWLESISDLSGEEIKKKNVKPSIWKDYKQFMDLEATSAHFVCDRCGTDFGNNEDWDDNVAFVEDGLSGITKMAKHFAAGPKQALTWPDIDAAGGHIEGHIDKCVSLKCSYILISHWDKEPDKIEGGTTITGDTVGNNLAPRLFKPFSEIILAERELEPTRYYWNLARKDVELKTRRLTYRAGLQPDFSQIFNNGDR